MDSPTSWCCCVRYEQLIQETTFAALFCTPLRNGNPEKTKSNECHLFGVVFVLDSQKYYVSRSTRDAYLYLHIGGIFFSWYNMAMYVAPM